MLFEKLAGLRALRFRYAALVCVAALLAASTAQAQEPWPARHHDGMRTGRAGGTASITNPTISWQHSLGQGVGGASVLTADVLGDSVPEYLVLVNGAVVARDSVTNVVRWDTPPLGVTRFAGVHDFNGDGRPEILLVGTIVVIVDGETGNVVWRATPSDPSSLSFRAPAVVPYNTDVDPEMELIFGHGGKEFFLYDFSEGFNNVDPVWSMTSTLLPNTVVRPVVGEFDGNVASQEIALINIRSCRAMFISLADGALLRETAATTAGVFCYGLAQAANVDDDPEDELLFTGNLGRGRGTVTLSVYDYNDDAMLWQHEYGTSGVDPRTTLAPAGAVADFDGDNDLEVAIAVYDNQDESRGEDDGVNRPDAWTVVIYDASDGSTVDTIDDATIHGITDLDGDGTNELLTLTAAPGDALPDEVGTLQAWGLDGQRNLTMLWEVANVSPITQAFPPNPRVQSRDYDRLPAIVDGDDGADWVLVSTGEDPATVQALDATGNQVDIAATVEVPGTAGVQLIDTGDDILGAPHVTLRASNGDFTVHDAALAETNQLVVVGHSSEVLIAPLIDGDGMQIVYRDSSNNVVALDVSSANQLEPPTVLWTKPANVPGEILTLDRDGDGEYEVVFSGRLDDDTVFVEMVDGGGTRLWQQTFPELDRPIYSLTAAQLGGQGNLRDVAGISFVAEGFSPVTYALDGTDGSMINTHTAVNVGPSPNDELILIPNPDDDGTDNLLLLHNVFYERLNSDLTPREEPTAYPPSNSSPLNSSVLVQDGNVAVFIKAFRNQSFVLDTNLQTTRWNEQLPPSLLSYRSGFAGFADANDDGTWDVAVPGVLGDVTVRDMLTGAVIYRLCLDGGNVSVLPEAATLETCVPIAPVSSILVADVDGDDQDEFVVGGADGWLYAINAEDGTASFAHDLGSQIFSPAVADMDGDGELEIALTTARSELLMVDHAEISPPTAVRDVEVGDGDVVVNGDTDVDTQVRTDVAGVSWDAVPLADTYLVRLTTLNNTDVVPSTNINGVGTEFVATGLNLIPGTSYRWHVTAVSDTLGAAPAVQTNGFLVTGEGPELVVGLTANPGTFNAGQGEFTRFRATVSSPGVTQITEVTVAVTDADDAEVYNFSLNPGVSTYTLNNRWDGLIEELTPAPAGTYTVHLYVEDATGQSIEDETTVSITDPGPPTIADLVANPTPFVPGAGETSAITATATSISIRPLTRVTFAITDADDATVVAREWTEDLENVYNLDFTWNGNNDADELSAPGTYTVSLSIEDGFGNTAESDTTVNIEAPGAPSISAFAADPATFTPGAGDTTSITASTSTRSISPLASVRLVITNEADAAVRTLEWTDDLGESYDVDFTWDGRDGEDAVVAPGSYTATLTVTDGLDASTEAQIAISVTAPGAPTVADLTAAPDTFIPATGETSSITATITSQSVAPLATVTLTILDEDDTAVRTMEWSDNLTGELALEFDWDGINDFDTLVAGGTYTVRVTAVDGFDASSEAETSVTVVTPGAPTLDDLSADPSEFNPALGESTNITGTVSSGSTINITFVRVRIYDANQAIVHEWIDESGDANEYTLDYTWEGTFPNDATVPSGEYTVEVTARDQLGTEVAEVTTVAVLSPSAPEIDSFAADPDTFDPNMSESTVLGGQARSTSNSNLVLSEIFIKDSNGATVFEAEDNPAAMTVDLSLTWRGTYPNGAIVTPGIYTATWTVTDAIGDSAQETATITILGEEEPDEDEGDVGPDAEPDADPDADAGDDTGADTSIPDPDQGEDESCTCQTPASTEGSFLRLLLRR